MRSARSAVSYMPSGSATPARSIYIVQEQRWKRPKVEIVLSWQQSDLLATLVPCKIRPNLELIDETYLPTVPLAPNAPFERFRGRPGKIIQLKRK